MSATTITIQVDADAAKAYAEVSSEVQRKMRLLLSLRLRDLTTPGRRSLQDLMDEISEKAKARGLTPSLLESLLRE